MRILKLFVILVPALMAFGLMVRAYASESEVLVVAHPNTPSMDGETLQKVFLGKVIMVNGVSVIPVNLAPGTAERRAFMDLVMGQGDEKFISYWTVRRYIGKGQPPKEFSSPQELLDYVRATPGAIGYLSGAVAKDGLVILLKRP
jgi:hypothetical protein